MGYATGSTVTVGGPPDGAELVRRVCAHRAPRGIPPRGIPALRDRQKGLLKRDQVAVHDVHRAAVAAIDAAWTRDRWVAVFTLDGLWHAAVYDGWGRPVANLTGGGVDHATAREVANAAFWLFREGVAAGVAA